MEPDIRIEGLTKKFRGILEKEGIIALDHLNLEVQRGEIFGFLGPNGAGKTTTLNLLLGFLQPTAGKAWILGERIGSIQIKEKIGFLPEIPASYEFLNAEEVLHFFGSLFGINYHERKRRIEHLLALVGLEQARYKKLGNYSKGMLQRIGLAESLINNPSILFLDEPTSGLDPIGRKEIRELLIQLRDEGKTIFLCSHLLSEIEMVCDRVGILHTGKLLKIGKLDGLLSERESYELTASDINEATLTKIKKSPVSVLAENDKVKISYSQVDLSTHLIGIIQSGGGKLISLIPKRENLEDLFIRIVSGSDAENRLS